jgi:hypothetical protein
MSRNEPATIFTLFIGMNGDCHNWRAAGFTMFSDLDALIRNGVAQEPVIVAPALRNNAAEDSLSSCRSKDIAGGPKKTDRKSSVPKIHQHLDCGERRCRSGLSPWWTRCAR